MKLRSYGGVVLCLVQLSIFLRRRYTASVHVKGEETRWLKIGRYCRLRKSYGQKGGQFFIR